MTLEQQVIKLYDGNTRGKEFKLGILDENFQDEVDTLIGVSYNHNFELWLNENHPDFIEFEKNIDMSNEYDFECMMQEHEQLNDIFEHEHPELCYADVDENTIVCSMYDKCGNGIALFLYEDIKHIPLEC